MSRHLAAYFAIVGTLAFAGGAADAGQVNIPHINIPRPQISVPTPHLSISPPRISVPTQTLSSARMNRAGFNPAGFSPGGGGPPIPNMVPAAKQFRAFTSVGSAQASPSSSTGGGGGGPNTSSGGSGYSTAGQADSSPSFRCRSKGGKSNCPL